MSPVEAPRAPPPDRADLIQFPFLPRRGPQPHFISREWSYCRALQHGSFGFKRFLQLPLEIRREIYKQYTWACKKDLRVDILRFILRKNHPAYRDQRGRVRKIDIARPIFLPQLCNVNEQIRQEASIVFIQQCTWVVRSYKALSFLVKFLETIPDERAFTAVKQVEFSNFGWFAGVQTDRNNKDVEFMVRCRSLRNLTMNIVARRLYIWPDLESETSTTNSCTAKSVDQLVAYYDLQQIFQCRNLKTIKFEGDFGEETDFELQQAQTALKGLGDWLQLKFLKQNRQTIEVRIIWP